MRLVTMGLNFGHRSYREICFKSGGFVPQSPVMMGWGTEVTEILLKRGVFYVSVI